MKLKIEYHTANEINIVEAEGEITVHNVAEFKTPLIGAAATAEDLVADLRKINYIDSAGIEALILAYSAMSKRNKPFAVLVAEGSQPMEVLRIVCFHTFSKLATDPAEVGLS